jgi:hypothetical protein
MDQGHVPNHLGIQQGHIARDDEHSGVSCTGQPRIDAAKTRTAGDQIGDDWMAEVVQLGGRACRDQQDVGKHRLEDAKHSSE